MKKILSTLLAVVLTASMAIPVFAGYEANSAAGEPDNGTPNALAFTIPKANAAPTIDGKIGDGEYGEIAFTKDMMSYAWADSLDKADAEAINWKLYGTYDDNYIYAAITCDAPADKYFNDLDQSDAGNIWQQSGIQLGFTTIGADKEEFNELGYARNSSDGSLMSVRWKNEAPEAADDYTPEPDTGDFTIGYANNTLTYEVRVPWTSFLKANAKEGDKILMGAVAALGRGDGEHLHSQLGYGITGDPGKHVDGFSTITLGAAPAVAEPEPEAEPETEAPAEESAVDNTPAVETPVAPANTATTTAPQTGNTTVIVLLAVMIVAAGAFVFLRKRAK